LAPVSGSRGPLGETASSRDAGVLQVGDGQTGGPSRCASMGWHGDAFRVVSAAGEQPRGQGVGVPHFACPELIAASRDGGKDRHQIQQALRWCYLAHGCEWTTAIGQGACDSNAWDTDPNVMPGRPPRPRHPTTSSCASWAAVSRAPRAEATVTCR
jgi:hypothetical protein